MSPQPSCTIIATSSSLSLARALVSRIIEHSGNPSGGAAGDSDSVEWTIDNKYYTAPVHFDVHSLSAIDGVELGPPALVYVFAKGKPFRDEFAKLQPALAEHDFEVSLAAALSAPGIAGGAHDDERDAEAFFREHGFEFVDGDATAGADAEDGNVGVPRIVDALSTILWPSMTRKGGQRASRLGALGGPSIVVGSGEEDALLSFLSGAGGPLHGSKRGDEMAALERWLEEDDDHSSEHHEIASPISAGGDGGLVPPHGAWTHFPTGSSTSLASPLVTSRPPVPEPSPSSFVPAESSSSTPHAGSPTATPAGFEDDFADFVTAPASESSFDTLDTDADAGYNALLDPDDEGLPSHDEIRSTSARIFGPNGPHPPEEKDPDFDIAHAFSALQAMRDEISGISDDTERRRAAARVALGFAYGLDLGSGDDDSGERKTQTKS